MANQEIFLKKVRQALQEKACSERAAMQEKYMRHKFMYMGVQMGDVHTIYKRHAAEFVPENIYQLQDVVFLLWEQEEREFCYIALDLLYKHKKLLTPEFLPTLYDLICSRSWWDTVDLCSAKIVGHIVKKYPESLLVMDRWIQDPNFWVRRSALLSQLKAKEKMDTKRLERHCLICMHEQEFFIQKAIGWMLREYSKTNQEWVRDFIEENKDTLAKLSIREGSKYL